MQKLTINWQEPLNFAKKISQNYHDNNWVFLYSALNAEVKNSKSYIGIFAKKQIITDSFFDAKNIIENGKDKYFGYISYETVEEFENLQFSQNQHLNLPKIHLINFSLTFEFDHKNKKLTAFFDDKNQLNKILNLKKKSPKREKILIEKIASNFSNKGYLDAINKIKNMILKGDFYQTNLTRKFFGNFYKKPNVGEAFSLFENLCTISPANYASFLKLNENFIISSSPELFLKSQGKNIYSKPIKGTSPRSPIAKQDKINKSYLKNSEKEKAENLMIVDLVRNDLSRVCKANSIKVKKLFAISTYKKLFHMSSEIHGKIKENLNTLDSISACFPAGSMTGAPKIQAMKTADKLENIQRGIYSGAIGIFAKNYINSSVVIRTLIIQDKLFEFQVGGAITFDSIAQSELIETFNKAKGLENILNIDIKNLF